jgi:endonuclease G
LLATPIEAIEGRLRQKGIAAAMAKSGLETLRRTPELFPASENISQADVALGLERIIGRNELLGVQYLDGGQLASRSVCRILVCSRSRIIPMGTGFMISPRLMLTNNHVLPTVDAAVGGFAQFNYQYGLDRQPLKPASFALEPEALFITRDSGELDFTLIAVRQTNDDGVQLTDFGHKSLLVLSNDLLAGESVTIIQHPGGKPKQIALRENFVMAIPNAGERYLHYQTDTTPGSSGSPVFNDDWELVALHHSGYARRNDQNQILTRDGRVWTDEMGEDQIDWIANEGIRVAELVRHLSAIRGLGANQRELLTSAIGETASDRAPVSARPAIETAHRSDPPPPADAVTEAVFNIPLSITVRLGAPGLTLAAGKGVAAAPVDTQAFEKILIDTDYGNRQGYDPKFLGGGNCKVPLPKMNNEMMENAHVVKDSVTNGSFYELAYHHYSVVLNSKRRMAYFTAVNIDGTQQQDLGNRENDRWIFDSRVEKDYQIGA